MHFFPTSSLKNNLHKLFSHVYTKLTQLTTPYITSRRNNLQQTTHALKMLGTELYATSISSDTTH